MGEHRAGANTGVPGSDQGIAGSAPPGRHHPRRVVARTLAVALLAVVGLLAPEQATAGSGPVEVLMLDSGDVDRFSPVVVDVPQGREIRFDNFGQNLHDAQDNEALGLFATDLLGPMGTETIAPLPGAGVFRYYCTFHPQMIGRFRVPVRVSPATLRRSATVTIRWAHDRAPSGLVFDVQRRRPGASQFQAWRTGVTGATKAFRPQERGTWSVRARVRRPATGRASSWSPVRTFQVT